MLEFQLQYVRPRCSAFRTLQNYKIRVCTGVLGAAVQQLYVSSKFSRQQLSVHSFKSTAYTSIDYAIQKESLPKAKGIKFRYITLTSELKPSFRALFSSYRISAGR
eukprot:SAG31_NODE_211_length_20274_cov_40.333482_9_plen_106_part_00